MVFTLYFLFIPPRFITSLRSTYSFIHLSIHPINIYCDLIHTRCYCRYWDGLVNKINKVPDLKTDFLSKVIQLLGCMKDSGFTLRLKCTSNNHGKYNGSRQPHEARHFMITIDSYRITLKSVYRKKA